MALIKKKDKHFVEVLDEESGALYNVVRHYNAFSKFQVKSGQDLGEGSFGKVHLLESTVAPTVFYAAKVVLFLDKSELRNQSRRRKYLKEAAALQSLDHKNIIKLHFCAMCPGFAMLVLSYCNKGHLDVEELSNKQVMKYFINILDAVRHMHSRRIVHRDIKLRNILVNNDDVFLADFDHSKKLPEDSNLVSGRSIGTIKYNAPEVYHATRRSVYDGFKADAYSVGVVLYCMLMREKPSTFVGAFNLWPILRDSWTFYYMDPALRNCVPRLLATNPDKRHDVTSIYHRLGRQGCVPGYTRDV